MKAPLLFVFLLMLTLSHADKQETQRILVTQMSGSRFTISNEGVRNTCFTLEHVLCQTMSIDTRTSSHRARKGIGINVSWRTYALWTRQISKSQNCCHGLGSRWARNLETFKSQCTRWICRCTNGSRTVTKNENNHWICKWTLLHVPAPPKCICVSFSVSIIFLCVPFFCVWDIIFVSFFNFSVCQSAAWSVW